MLPARFLMVMLLALAPAQGVQAQPLRGDVDGDLAIDLSDAINVLDFLFLGNFPIHCQAVADANHDGELDISDPAQILRFLFLGGSPFAELSAEESAGCRWNAPPTVAPRPVFRAYPGHPAEFLIEASDPEGEQLRFQPVSLPPGASIDQGGLLRWTPGPDQLGPFYLRFAVLDEDIPPNRVEGMAAFHVLPLDGCTRPHCDPVLGCVAELVDLPEECCGPPAERVPDPEVGCPEGMVLHIGRNEDFRGSIGRLQNCDLLRLVPRAQGGHRVHFNVEARCLEGERISLQARLETSRAVLFDGTPFGFLLPRSDGHHESRDLAFTAEGRFDEGQEAMFTVTASDDRGSVVQKKLRIVITRYALPDLP